MKHMIKQLGNELYDKHLITLAILSILSILIWFGGPLLTIGHHAPLSSGSKRFYLILLIALVLGIKNYFQTSAAPAKTQSPKHPELLKKFQSLEGRFKGAMDFLKKTTINKNGKETTLVNLPWYLVMGLPNSGKTSLMANAGINYILAKQFKDNNTTQIPASDSCDWWVTRDSVLVDVPGCYLQKKFKPGSAPTKRLISWNHLLWQKFLELLQSLRGQQALNGIILTFSATDLMEQPAEHFVELELRLKELKQTFNTSLPVYVSITKCDALPGFQEFFSDSGADELNQAWGVTLNQHDASDLISTFTTRFDSLIKRLNKQLIWRLHQERNGSARPLVKDFPLQIERLKGKLTNVLKVIHSDETALHLKAVFLNSAIQHKYESSADFIEEPCHALQILRNPIMPNKAYFIRQFLTSGIMLSLPEPIQSPPPPPRRLIHYSVPALVALVTIMLFSKNIQQNLSQTFALKQSLEYFSHNLSNEDIDANLTFAKTMTLLDNLQSAALSSPALLQEDKAQKSANAAYLKALQTLVLPQVKQAFENYLSTENHTHLEKYNVLKAYLMLDDKQHLDKEYVGRMFASVLPHSLTIENRKHFMPHLRNALAKTSSLALNPELVSNLRNQLTHLTPVHLSFILLKSFYSDEVTALQPVKKSIPTFYTATAYNKITKTQVDRATDEAVNGNWILGKITNNTYQDTPAILAAKLKDFYIKNYAKAWENILLHTQFSAPSNLDDADNYLIDLSQPEGFVNLWMHTIEQNTYFAPVMAESSQLLVLNSYVGKARSTRQNDLQTNALHAHSYLKQILKKKNAHESAFDIIAAYMSDATHPLEQLRINASALPTPLQNWVISIVDKTSQAIVADASSDIKTAWQTQIGPVFKASYATKFPFKSDAAEEVSIKDFNQFLGPEGTVVTFYNKYLHAFVNTDPAGWQFKTIAGSTLHIDPKILIAMQNLYNFHSGVYSQGQIDFKFTLQPLALSKHTKKIDLVLNGKNFSFTKHPKSPTNIEWAPGNQPGNTSLTIISNYNRSAQKTFSGEWGLLKLLNDADPKVINTTTSGLVFSVGNFNEKFLMWSTSGFNLVGLVGIRLPEVI